VLGTAPWRARARRPPAEARHLVADGPVQVWALDSASLAGPQDAGRVLVTGSHGALLGGRAETALRADAVAVVFNDAGGAGRTRLPVLDLRGVPAATVAAGSARIGDGRSTYEDGVISAVNRAAAESGARVGMTVRAWVTDVAGRAATRGRRGDPDGR
ncbi:hypothetical protein AB0I15_47035, partial [Nonomuraea sp. NPDC050643]